MLQLPSITITIINKEIYLIQWIIIVLTLTLLLLFDNVLIQILILGSLFSLTWKISPKFYPQLGIEISKINATCVVWTPHSKFCQMDLLNKRILLDSGFQLVNYEKSIINLLYQTMINQIFMIEHFMKFQDLRQIDRQTSYISSLGKSSLLALYLDSLFILLGLSKKIIQDSAFSYQIKSCFIWVKCCMLPSINSIYQNGEVIQSIIVLDIIQPLLSRYRQIYLRMTILYFQLNDNQYVLKLFQSYFFQKDHSLFILIGLLMTFVGHSFRIGAFISAKQSFHHQVQSKKASDHVLITTGVYKISRHPSYFGFFIYSLGQQIVLLNPIAFIAYIPVLYKFFISRIYLEEYYLHQFFGYAYQEYSANTPILIPFIEYFLRF